jgi:hypothetical protein
VDSGTKQLVDPAIADAVCATRCTAYYNSAVKTTPGGLAFGRDMILNIPLITDLEQLQKRRQGLIDQRLIAANTKRFSYDYQIGDEALPMLYMQQGAHTIVPSKPHLVVLPLVEI